MSTTRQAGAWRPDVPSTLDGRYAIEAEIEALAYGVLYAGRDLEADEAVSLTVFHPAFFAAPHRKRNLARLTKTLRYRHPNLATVRAVVDAHDPVYVVADPLVGQPLTLWRRDGRDPASAPESTYRIVGQLLGALEDVHRHGIHGAIGPSTVRIAGDDLWMTNPWHLDPPAELPPGELPSLRAVWLAPEQLYDVAPEGPATDIYAAGLVLGYLLARGLTEPGHSLMVQGLDVAPALDEVYVNATARQPELRYTNVDELRRALEDALGAPWSAAQAALEGPVYERVLAQSAQPEAAGAVFVGASADAPAAHPSTDDTPFEGIPILARTLVDGEPDVDRTVEEEAIPAEIHDVTATAEALAVPLDPSGIVDARELDVALELPPPPLPVDADEAMAAADEAIVTAEVLEAVDEIAPQLPSSEGGAPPPLPVDAEWVGPPTPGDTVPSDTPPVDIAATEDGWVEPRLGDTAPEPAPPLPADADWVGPPGPHDTLTSDVPPELAGPTTEDTGERLALAAGGESWVLEARKLSEAVRTGAPIEAGITRLPSDATETAGADVVEVEEPAVALGIAPAGAAVDAPDAAAADEPPVLPPPIPAPSSRATGRRSRPDAPIVPPSLTIEVASGSTESIGPRTGPAARPPTADGPLTRTGVRPVVPPPTERSGSRRGLWIAAAAFLILGGVAAALLFGGDGASNGTTPDGGDAWVGPADAGGSADVGAVALADAGRTDTAGADTALAASRDAGEDGGVLAMAGVDGGEPGPDVGDEADTIAPEDAEVPDPGEDTAAPEEDTAEPERDTVTPIDTAVVAAQDTVEAPAADTAEPVAAVEDTVAPEEDTKRPATAFVPTDWRKLKCPGGMAKIRKRLKVTLDSGEEVTDWEVFCIDRYEAPGQGQPPSVDIDLAGAKSACRAAGKRLCSRTEWRRGCGGKYPYGKTYDPDACNSVGSDGMPRPVLTSGTKARCKSGWGVYDMVGNVAEWTSDGTVNGGGAYKHGENGTCYQSSRRAGGHPYVGYRCCADAR